MTNKCPAFPKHIILFMIIVLAVANPALAQNDNVIKIYTSWALSGATQQEGESMLNAARLALRHYLEDHNGEGPAGFTVELVPHDGASPETGTWDSVIEAENALSCVNDPQCLIYFGTYHSSTAKVSIPIMNQAGIAQITPANTYPGLTKSWDEGEPEIYQPSGTNNFFRTNTTDDFQGFSAAAWTDCLGFEKVYILDDRQLYGEGVADAFQQRAEEIGLEIVGRDGVESTDIDFTALLNKVREFDPDMVYGGFLIESGAIQVIQTMHELGMFDEGVKFMGPDTLANTVMIEAVGGYDIVANNVYLTFPGLLPTQLTSETGQRFLTDYRAEYGSDPIGWSVYAYQAMQVILDSIERAGVADRTAILNAMRETTNFEGIASTFSFDENGDADHFTLVGNVVGDNDIEYVTNITPTMNENCPE